MSALYTALTELANAHTALHRIPRADIVALADQAAERLKERRAMRDFKLFEIRCELREMGRNGGLTVQEMFDLVCTLQASAAPHLNEAKESLSDLACDLEGVMHGGQQ